MEIGLVVHAAHYFLKTLQAALDFEMKSLKIRDLLHLCQSSLGIIERNNLPNASLTRDSRNLSSTDRVPLPLRCETLLTKSEICVESQQGACNRLSKNTMAAFYSSERDVNGGKQG